MIGWLRTILLLWKQSALGGLTLWRLAPVLPFLALITELVQHGYEIHIGMFASKAAFKALAMDATRWQFGMVKLAAFWLTILGATVLRGSFVRPWYALGKNGWLKFVFAFALNAAAAALSAFLPKLGSQAADLTIQTALFIATLPLLPYLFGACFGDSTMTLRRAYTSGWAVLLRILVLVVPIFAIGQAIHRADHMLAMGQAMPLVWVLMIWDAVWVALFAAATGTALALGYRGTDCPSATMPDPASS